MTKDFRSAILDMIWASSLEALQAAYRPLQDKLFTATSEKRRALFNELVNHWALENRHT